MNFMTESSDLMNLFVYSKDMITIVLAYTDADTDAGSAKTRLPKSSPKHYNAVLSA